MLLPIAAYLLTVRPDRRLLTATLWPDDPDRRMLVLLLAVPLVLPILTAPLIGVVLTPLWTMSAWFLLPIILLAPAQIPVTRAVTMRVALAVVIITAVVFAAAPLVAWRNFAAEAKDGRACCRVAVDELTKAWHAAMQRPLSLVAGDSALSQGASFYSSDHPDSAPDYLGDPGLDHGRSASARRLGDRLLRQRSRLPRRGDAKYRRPLRRRACREGGDGVLLRRDQHVGKSCFHPGAAAAMTRAAAAGCRLSSGTDRSYTAR